MTNSGFYNFYYAKKLNLREVYFWVRVGVYNEIGQLELHAGSFVFDLWLMIFDLFLELGVGFEDDLQFFLEGLLLAVDSGGIG